MTAILFKTPGSMLVHHVGDLLAADEPVIAHGCNCQGIMGAGIARQIAKRYRVVHYENARACAAGEFHPGDAQLIGTHDGRRVFNLGTQRYPGADATYLWLRSAFKAMVRRCEVEGITRVGMPRIGCGIGGLDWDHDVFPALQYSLNESSHGLVIAVYDLPPRT